MLWRSLLLAVPVVGMVFIVDGLLLMHWGWKPDVFYVGLVMFALSIAACAFLQPWNTDPAR